jgi:hypothetical protein
MNIKDPQTVALISALKALVHLDHNNLKAAAKSFLEIDFCLDSNDVILDCSNLVK